MSERPAALIGRNAVQNARQMIGTSNSVPAFELAPENIHYITDICASARAMHPPPLTKRAAQSRPG